MVEAKVWAEMVRSEGASAPASVVSDSCSLRELSVET
jgi:hypothetical protein